MKVVVTGATGLVGSHIVDALVERGHDVRGFATCSNQEHFLDKPWINPKISLVRGSVTNTRDLEDVLSGADLIVHQAGLRYANKQKDYIDVNAIGTLNLFEVIKSKKLKIKKIIYASTNLVYGEGKYFCENHGVFYPSGRTLEQLEKKEWELKCPECKQNMKSLPVKEDSPTNTSEFYGLTKLIGEVEAIKAISLDIPVVVFRTPLIYGPREYKGLCQIFSTKLYNKQDIKITEDGGQLRDFIYIDDVVNANLFAVEKDIVGVFNLSSGKSVSLFEFLNSLQQEFNIAHPNITVTGNYRRTDIRHSLMDDTKIRNEGFTERTSLVEGLKRFRSWVENEYGLDAYFKRTSNFIK